MSDDWKAKLKAFVGRLDENYDADEKSDARSGSRWNRLLDRVAKEIERVMRSELLQPPGEPAYIPPEYLVFLSVDDERELRGDRRTGFLRGLRNATAEAAGKLVGGRAQTERLFVQIKADGGLQDDEFFVKPLWDVEHDPTRVGARSPTAPKSVAPEPLDEETRVVPVLSSRPEVLPWLILIDEGESTPARELKIASRHFTIGRGGKQVKVNLELPDDPEISRHHLTVHVNSEEGLVVEVLGRNPVRLDGAELSPGDQRPWTAGQPLLIGRYRLRLIEPPSPEARMS